MSKLERKNHKVFGINATETKVGQFGSTNATTKITTKDVEKIQALDAWEQGWEAGAVGNNRYPTQQERTGVDYEHSYQIGYMLQEGVPEWNKDTTFNKGSIVKAYNGTTLQIYVSLVDENLNNPVTDITKWKSGLANSDLSNLTETGEKHFLNKSQVTNCLLEVPQRIKLELNDGVLTLKAGSQVIIPNGFEADGTTPKFDYVITEQDMQYHNTSQFDKVFLCITKDLTSFVGHQEEKVSSGSAEQTTTGTHYNTTLNKVTSKLTSGVTYEVSLPICTLSTDSNGAVTSFNIFNGMGYISSTVWVDKGVKGLIPDGRNSDGSLINEETTTNRLSLKTYTTETVNSLDIWIYRNSAENLIEIVPSIETNSAPPAGFYGVNKEKNIIISHLNEQEHCFNAGTGSISNGKITSFGPKLPFRTADENDIDGKWVSIKPTTLTTITSGSATLDLSDILPNDNYAYELLLFDLLGAITGGQLRAQLSSSLIPYLGATSFTITRVFLNQNGVGTAIFPVGADKILTLTFLGINNSGSPSGGHTLVLCGYRRLGKTN